MVGAVSLTLLICYELMSVDLRFGARVLTRVTIGDLLVMDEEDDFPEEGRELRAVLHPSIASQSHILQLSLMDGRVTASTSEGHPNVVKHSTCTAFLDITEVRNKKCRHMFFETWASWRG